MKKLEEADFQIEEFVTLIEKLRQFKRKYKPQIEGSGEIYNNEKIAKLIAVLLRLESTNKIWEVLKDKHLLKALLQYLDADGVLIRGATLPTSAGKIDANNEKVTYTGKWNQEDFLILQLFTYIKHFVELKRFKKNYLEDFERVLSKIDKVKKFTKFEILVLWEMYILTHAYRIRVAYTAILKIPKAEERKNALLKLFTHYIKCISPIMDNHREFCIPCGSSSHAVYLMLSKEEHLFKVRVDDSSRSEVNLFVTLLEKQDQAGGLVDYLVNVALKSSNNSFSAMETILNQPDDNTGKTPFEWITLETQLQPQNTQTVENCVYLGFYRNRSYRIKGALEAEVVLKKLDEMDKEFVTKKYEQPTADDIHLTHIREGYQLATVVSVKPKDKRVQVLIKHVREQCLSPENVSVRQILGLERWHSGKQSNAEMSIECVDVNLAMINRKTSRRADKKEDGKKDNDSPYINSLTYSSRKMNSSSELEYEQVYNERETIPLSELLSEDATRPNNISINPSQAIIYIEGWPGVGKTVFCQKLAYLWASDSSIPHMQWWPKDIQLVLRIPLRNIANYDAKDCRIGNVVLRECLSTSASYTCNNSLTPKHIEASLKALGPQVVLILDGFDEVEAFYNKERESSDDYTAQARLLHDLVEANNHIRIVTSRPNYLRAIKRQPWKSFLTVGFTPENISNYIGRFFKKYERESHGLQLCKDIEQYENLADIAKIPINLVILCYLWNGYEEGTHLPSVLTRTQIYDLLLLWLIKQDFYTVLIQKGVDETAAREIIDNKPITFFTDKKSDDIHHASTQDGLVYDLLRKIDYGTQMRFLEDLAWEGILKRKSYDSRDFGGVDVDKVLSDAGVQTLYPHGWILSHRLLGLLHKSFETANLEKKYYFEHRTFQEYFSARKWARMFRSDSTSSEAESLFRSNKFDQKFRSTWTFASGLLCGRSEHPLISKLDSNIANQFFELLLLPPNDFCLINEFCLILLCLEEAAIAHLQYKYKITEYVVNTFILIFNKATDLGYPLEDEIISNLASHLSKCPRVFCDDVFMERLNKSISEDSDKFTRRVLWFLRRIQLEFPQTLLRTLDKYIFDKGDLSNYTCQLLENHPELTRRHLKRLQDYLMSAQPEGNMVYFILCGLKQIPGEHLEVNFCLNLLSQLTSKITNTSKSHSIVKILKILSGLALRYENLLEIVKVLKVGDRDVIDEFSRLLSVSKKLNEGILKNIFLALSNVEFNGIPLWCIVPYYIKFMKSLSEIYPKISELLKGELADYLDSPGDVSFFVACFLGHSNEKDIKIINKCFSSLRRGVSRFPSLLTLIFLTKFLEVDEIDQLSEYVCQFLIDPKSKKIGLFLDLLAEEPSRIDIFENVLTKVYQSKMEPGCSLTLLTLCRLPRFMTQYENQLFELFSDHSRGLIERIIDVLLNYPDLFDKSVPILVELLTENIDEDDFDVIRSLLSTLILPLELIEKNIYEKVFERTESGVKLKKERYLLYFQTSPQIPIEYISAVSANAVKEKWVTLLNDIGIDNICASLQMYDHEALLASLVICCIYNNFAISVDETTPVIVVFSNRRESIELNVNLISELRERNKKINPERELIHSRIRRNRTPQFFVISDQNKSNDLAKHSDEETDPTKEVLQVNDAESQEREDSDQAIDVDNFYSSSDERSC